MSASQMPDKSSAIALVIGLLLALTISFIRRPGHTMGFLGCLGLLGLAGAQPLACIFMLGLVGVVVVMLGTRRETAKLLLLTDGRENLGATGGPPPLLPPTRH